MKSQKSTPLKSIDVAQLVERLGLSVAKIESKNFRCACVNCPSSDAMGVHRQRGIARCWACGYKASPYRLALRALNDDTTAARALMLDVGEFVAQAKTKSKKKSKGPKAMMATVDAQSITPGKESASEDSITHPGVDQIAAVSEVLVRVAAEKAIADPAWLVRYGAMASADTHGGACLKLPAYSPTGEYRALFRIWPDNPTLDEKLNKTLKKGIWREGDPRSLFLPQPLGWKDWTTPRLPAPAEHWRLCEGVKDASVLAGEFGLLVVGMPGNDCPDIDLAKMFGGCKATLILDADHAGVIGAYRTAERLHAAGIETYVVVPPVDIAPKHGLDCRDILALPDGKAMLQDALEGAMAWQDAFQHEKLAPIIANAMNAPSQSTPGPTNTTLPPITTTLSIWDEAGRTDVANGKRFAARFKDDLRWCELWQKWLWWDGARWAVDRQRKVELLAKQHLEELLAEIAAGADSHDREETKAAFRFVLSLGSQRRLEAMIKLARSEPGISIVPDQLDADPWSLNCTNGTIDLRTMELRSHQREDLITRVVPHAFDPEAPAPLWRKFVREIFNEDHELIGFVRRLAGYSLTGSTAEHVLPIAYGKGANGKSVFINTILGVVGSDYGLACEPRLLMSSGSEQHPTGVADLFGRRFCAAIESSEGGKLNETLVKALTGSDRVRARRMREDFWEFVPSHKIWLATNHRPVIRGTDAGIWRRLRLIPFNQDFQGRENKRLGEQLQAESTGILSWMVFGAYAWCATGLKTPDAVTNATGQYRTDQDAIGAFIDAECIVDPSSEAKASDLYKRYVSWCVNTGKLPVNQRGFGKALTERGFGRKNNNGVWYLGLGLED